MIGFLLFGIALGVIVGPLTGVIMALEYNAENKKDETTNRPKELILSKTGQNFHIISETSRGFRVRVPLGYSWDGKTEKFYTWKDLHKNVEEPIASYVVIKLEEEKALNEIEELKN